MTHDWTTDPEMAALLQDYLGQEAYSRMLDTVIEQQAWFDCARLGDEAFIKEKICQFQQSTDSRDNGDGVTPGFSALMYAVQNKHQPIIDLLQEAESAVVCQAAVKLQLEHAFECDKLCARDLLVMQDDPALYRDSTALANAPRQYQENFVVDGRKLFVSKDASQLETAILLKANRIVKYILSTDPDSVSKRNERDESALLTAI